MKGYWWIAGLVVLMAPGAVMADVGVPGFKSRELRVVIDNLDDYPNHVFYLVAAGWVVPGEKEMGPGKPEKPSRVVPGELHRPGYSARWAHNWMLVAVPRDRAASVDWNALAQGTPGVLHSNRVQLSQPGSVIFLSPEDYETRHFRVTLADGQLTLTPGAVEEGSDGFASWFPAIALATAFLGFGLLMVWVARRVRRKARARSTLDTRQRRGER